MMQEMTMPRTRQQRQFRTATTAFLVGVLTGFAVSQRLTTIARWRRGDQAFIRRVAQFNKQWTNRATMTFAGRRHSPYAVIRHVGRRSGRPYATPVITAPVPGGFVIPLAYGDTTDWYRNLQAAGGCMLEWQGNTYTVDAPELVDGATVVSAFPRFWRRQLRQYGISRFVKVVQVQQRAESPTLGTEPRRESLRHNS
jgi:deazaflavin-dependent oxidoreductase (nitroreductase family)